MMPPYENGGCYAVAIREDLMLDIHPPHSRIQGFKDFSLHLLTITIGLLIALSLESCVEWQHRRHLVREAEDGLNGEVKENIEATCRPAKADQRRTEGTRCRSQGPGRYPRQPQKPARAALIFVSDQELRRCGLEDRANHRRLRLHVLRRRSNLLRHLRHAE